MTELLNIEALRKWIGSELHGSDIVTPELVARFRATFNLTGADAAGTVAPQGIHWCLAPSAVPTELLGHDGHPQRGGFLPPIALPRRMWAGGALQLRHPIKIGDHVLRRSRIDDIALKEGRTGPLCFMTVTHQMTVQNVSVIDERQDIVFRGLQPGSPAASGRAARHAGRTMAIRTDPPLLFRYSALTFNGHRIHYDRRYCLEEEGYPGLVVHGPFQATMLLHFAGMAAGTPPKSFAFRSVAPLFDEAAFSLNAIDEDSVSEMWTANEAGVLAMTAEARW